MVVTCSIYDVKFLTALLLYRLNVFQTGKCIDFVHEGTTLFTQAPPGALSAPHACGLALAMHSSYTPFSHSENNLLCLLVMSENTES